jgi:hypothetical protein
VRSNGKAGDFQCLHDTSTEESAGAGHQNTLLAKLTHVLRSSANMAVLNAGADHLE